MFVCTAAASLIAVLLAGPPPAPSAQAGPNPARVGGHQPAGAIPPVGGTTPLDELAPLNDKISAVNRVLTSGPREPKARHIVTMGKDGVRKEIVVVPLPLDASGMPAGPVQIPDFGFQSFQTTSTIPRHKGGRDTAPQWRDRNWDRAWEQRREQNGEHGRRAKRDRRRQAEQAHHKKAKQRHKAKRGHKAKQRQKARRRHA